MKLYFHFNLLHAGSCFTAAVDTEGCGEDNLKKCLKQVCKVLYEERKIDIDVHRFELFNDKNKTVNIDSSLSKLNNGDDIMINVDDVASKSKVVFEKSDIKNNDKPLIPPTSEKTVVHSGNDETVNPKLKAAENHVTNKRRNKALALYLEVLETHPNNHDALFGAAYIYYNAERFKDSVPYFEKLISKGPADEVALLDFSRALIQSGDAAKAASVVSRCINDLKRSNKPVDQIHDANVVLGEALESLGQLPNAFQLYLTVAQMTEKQHLAGLIGYARVGYQINHVTIDDVFIVILNALAHHKNDSKFHSYFADMVQECGGFDALRKQMHDLWYDAKTILYIATFLRECGALDECMKLVKHAFSQDKSNANIALLILHLHENICDVYPGLVLAAEFFNAMLAHQVVRKIDLSPISKVLQYLEKKDDDQLQAFLGKHLSPEKEAKQPSTKGTLSPKELELLGMYFTVVKICYVQGHLTVIPLFIKLLDPLFKVNDDIHKTSIRNEQAYYSCISKIYESIPPPVCTDVTQKLYFVGDSHALPVAWRNIKSNGQDYVIHPILVTGLKIWHLRKESRFYTKSCFNLAMKSIPTGAACVFAFGEIDCREGVIEAVEDCKYDDADEGMKCLAEIYVKCLLEIKRSKKAKIFVHPVPPVLKETSQNVMTFNQHLKNRLLKTPKLFWLDFLENLVDERTEYLKGEFEFDGSHLNPSYVSLLENSLQKHL